MQTYRVLRGDNLSTLAVRFSVPLDALVRANKRQSNPNLIRDGETLRIPRARQKYLDMIAALEDLSRESDQDFRDRIKELTVIERDAATFGGRVDLAADVATCFVGMGKALLTYGCIVRKSALRKEMFNAVQKVIVYGASDEPGDAANAAFKAVGKATADQSLRLFGPIGPVDQAEFAGKIGKSLGKDATNGVAKHVIKSYIAIDKQSTSELLVHIAVQAAWTGFTKASDIAGAVSPSNLAHVWMKWRNGADLRTTIADSRQAISASHQRVKQMLAARIAAVREEMKEAYG